MPQRLAQEPELRKVETNYAMVPRQVEENYAMLQLSLRRAEESAMPYPEQAWKRQARENSIRKIGENGLVSVSLSLSLSSLSVSLRLTSVSVAASVFVFVTACVCDLHLSLHLSLYESLSGLGCRTGPHEFLAWPGWVHVGWWLCPGRAGEFGGGPARIKSTEGGSPHSLCRNLPLSPPDLFQDDIL